MKILKIIFFGFLALGMVACMAVFIFFQTFSADQYLPQITAKISSVLGRPVTIGHIGPGISRRGIGIDLWPVIVADDPAFTSQPFIKIDRVRINVDLMALALRHEIHLTGILLESPQIHFILSQEGGINISSLSKEFSLSVKRPPTRVIASEAKQSFNTEKIVAVPQDGTASGKTSRNDAMVGFSTTIHGAAVSLIDQDRSMPLDIWLTGIDLNLNKVSLSEPFALSFDASFCSNVPNIHASAILSLDASKHSFTITDLKLQMDLSEVDPNLLKYISPQLPDNAFFKDPTGLVQLAIDHLAIGPSGAIETKGSLVMSGIVIKNFNIIKTVFSQTLGIFGITEHNIDNLLSGNKLDAEDTIINKAQVNFSIHDKTIFIDDSLVQTNILELTAKGTIAQGLNMDLQTVLHLNDDVSEALVGQFDGLKLLMDDSKRIAIDASLKGDFPHLKYKPNKDFRKKSKKALMQEGGNILGALLGGGQITVNGQDVSSAEQGKKIKKNIRNIFKSLLQ